ncbi:hypothetical protein G0Q06_08410 [Puniceicoccales bacterium CK1056]|uniref:Mannosyl-glycoprotein endo-beta-N-acetylglucosamidase-like domain-containing protein n=1 Tax=Oceanipulchritudo coccoides TaxID=2706888 RepID=A0A6B2M2P6_9BACT|nr:glucosaminidase domain-containing protein [Oceanipulchritudo coccoides]NDV62469.1 hypothetical protein [Oceanipulchritudo coccoides]
MPVSLDKILSRSKRHYWMNPAVLAGILIAAVVLIVVLIPVKLGRDLPDFSKIDDIGERKAAFFEFLKPYVDRSDLEILSQRKRLEAINGNLDRGPMSRRNERWVRQLASAYEMEIDPESPLTADLVGSLLERVDIIPQSMALAQAALESGWGTSRFAQQGNNLYGVWCYEPGCGIVPKRRPAGATYEVKKYSTPKESFDDYIQNLNTNPAYLSLRQIRSSLRREGKPVTGIALSDGLYRYSEEGWTYIGKIQRVIQTNNLQIYDTIKD